ncbi:MAG: hypothetical protein AAF078_04350 [Planctomycetota bacterium]
MVGKLKQNDSEFALPVSEEVMREMGIDASTPLDLRVQDGCLIVTKASDAAPIDLDQALREVRARYATMLKRLA